MASTVIPSRFIQAPWTIAGSDIYYNTGKVVIGNISPSYLLEIFSALAAGFRTTGAIDINQVAEPTAPTMALVTTAGNVDVGAHWYFVSYTTAMGETRSIVSATQITTDGTHKQVTVTIPVSTDTRVTGRKIYRTKAGDPVYNDFILATIANNTATSYVDNIADASLTGSGGASILRTNTTHKFITVQGVKALIIDTNLTTLGVNAGAAITVGGRDTLIGSGAGQARTAGNDNTDVGHYAGNTDIVGYQNTNVGSFAGALGSTAKATNLGYSAGYSNLIGDGCVNIGALAGYYETGANKFFVDNQGRTNEVTARISSLLYGVFSGTVASQTLAINANLGVQIPPTAAAFLSVAAGTTSIAPVNLTSGTNKTTPIAGDIEFDGVNYYATIDATSKRGAIPVEQYFHLTAAGSTIGTTIGNFFGATSNISLVASAYYEIEIVVYYLKTTAGTVTWTLTNSAAPTSQNVQFEMSPVTGIVAPPGGTGRIEGTYYNDATAARTIVTASLTTAVSHYNRIKIYLQNGTGTSLKLQVTCSAGTLTPGINSYWFCKRRSPNNIGTFAA